MEKLPNIKNIFFSHSKLICLSDKAISAFRVQNYYKGLGYLRLIIDTTVDIAPEILRNQDYFNEDMQVVHEDIVNSILSSLLEANETFDYVLLADILELRWIPFLITLQEIIISKEGILYQEDLFDKNVNVLMKTDSVLTSKLKKEGTLKPAIAMDGYLLEPTSCGLLTLALYDNDMKFYLHSNGQVLREAMLIAGEWFSPFKSTYHIYGLGLGYPMIELAGLDETIVIHIYESDWNILRFAFTYTDMTQLIDSDRIYIHYDPEFIQLSSFLGVDEEDTVFAIHYPSIRNIKNSKIREQLEDYFISYSSVKNQINQLNGNFKRNILNYDATVDCLKESFAGKDLIIVAAGPSLDKNFRELKSNKKNTIILVTGTVFKKLIMAGIQPDYVIISDATAAIYHQFEGLAKVKVPLLFLSTTFYKIPQTYSGKRYLICQRGYTKAEEYAAKMDYNLYQSGGSVSTAALDIGIRFQCNRIIFIGLDLAYTNNLDHAADTTDLIKFDRKDLRMIEDIYGGMVSTGKNLDLYRKWIEHRIKETDGIEFINATEGGAKIHGMQNMKLLECFSGNTID